MMDHVYAAVQKQSTEAPGNRRSQPMKRLKLDPFTDTIDRIPEDDRMVHRKQRHTAKRTSTRPAGLVTCTLPVAFTIVPARVQA